MRELSMSEVDFVGGATTSGDIAMVAATAWVSTVAGAAVGSVVPVGGTLIGATAGFLLGVATGVGFVLTQE